MPIRSTLLLTGCAMLAVAVPAAAQDDRYAAIATALPAIEGNAGDHHAAQEAGEEVAGEYDGAWQGEWSDDQTWQGEWTGSYTDAEGRRSETDYRGVWMGDQSRGAHGAHHAPRFAYSPAEREQWLTDCQYLMADGGGYYEDDRDRDSRFIGGLLGAVFGGIAGNRIADGNRTLGTIAGAGLGGLAGVAIGSVLDGDGDGELSRNEVWAARYCDAYLRRHELGGGEFARSQQVMMVPVAAAPRHRRSRHHREDCRSCREVVTEEWVETERPAPRPRPEPRPVPQPQGKLTPIN